MAPHLLHLNVSVRLLPYLYIIVSLPQIEHSPRCCVLLRIFQVFSAARRGFLKAFVINSNIFLVINNIRKVFYDKVLSNKCQENKK